MEGELQRLREQVEQLQTANARLSGVQNGGTGGNVGDEIPPVRREHAFYLPKERKCPKFSGSTAAGALSVEEWTEEAQSCIRSRHMSVLDKAMFLYDHLEGEARNEIKYRPVASRENPDEIIRILKEMYGCTKSYVHWQQRFFDRKQRENESLFEFSHALMELMDRVKQSKGDAIFNSGDVLRDQFCENVRDHTLRRELKRLVRDDEDLSILDVRREAIRWLEEGQPGRDRGQRALPRSHEVRFAPQCEATIAQTSELAELKEMVLRQQAQLDMLVKRFCQPSGNAPSPSHRNGHFRRTSDGQPICLRCGEPGHIARYCRSAPLPSATNSQDLTVSRSNSVNQSEN
ncbi:uncharacterized protein LOC143502078 [Brachyhypopomus gauderio]|uniref:uncharacterized protein LOC143502078 n=1 Tax=Brachyhypopomus gauderio TaxID=698409 RepID=UPI00404330F4